jgi:hypothetical protein
MRRGFQTYVLRLLLWSTATRSGLLTDTEHDPE